MKLSLKIILPLFLAALACQTINGMEEPPSPKKRKEGEESSKQQGMLCPRAFFNSKEIEDLISKLMIEEKGKIFAAYFMVTSEFLSSWWADRKYIQESTPDISRDIQKPINLERYKTSPKEDVLIVDESCLNQDMRAVKKISDSGIKVLIRNINRDPSNHMQIMHHKFIIFFDEGNKTGKFAIIGSYNMTNQAQYNFEDATIFNNPELIAQFIQKHHELRQYCTDYEELELRNILNELFQQANLP